MSCSWYRDFTLPRDIFYPDVGSSRFATRYRLLVAEPSQRSLCSHSIRPVSFRFLSARSTVFRSMLHSAPISFRDGKQVMLSSQCRSRQQYTASSLGFRLRSNILLGTIKKFLCVGIILSHICSFICSCDCHYIADVDKCQ